MGKEKANKVFQRKLVWLMPLCVLVGTAVGVWAIKNWLPGFVVGMMFSLALASLLARRAMRKTGPDSTPGMDSQS